MLKIIKKIIYKNNNLVITLIISILLISLIKSPYIKANINNRIKQIIVEDDNDLYRDSAQLIDSHLNDLINKMTLKEKIREMYGFDNSFTAHLPMIFPFIKQRYSNTRLEIPAFAGTNGPMGLSFYGTRFPVGIARGASWDSQLEYEINSAIGEEARSIGSNLFFSPTINIIRHPGWGRAQESYGEDPFHIGIMGVSAIKGLQNNVIAQAKHYVGNSIEKNRFTINIKINERTLREIYLPQFKAAVQKGNVASIMSAYNRVNGSNMAENKHLLNDILKDEWGFQGFIATDWNAYGDTINSAFAGLDVQMPVPTFYGEALFEAVNKGEVPESLINDSVRRVLRKKFEFGLFDNESSCNLFALYKNRNKNKELALKSAQKSIVLLKNKDDIMPIDSNKINKIAVIGPYANRLRLGDITCIFGLNYKSISPLEGIKNKAGNIKIRSYTGSLKALAKSTAKSADIAIVIVGLSPLKEGESLKILNFPVGGDRKQLGLPANQVDLIKSISEINDNVIVVIQAGSAITMENWIDDVEGVLMAWYPGLQGGNAIADILFGNVNPSGKLPLTFPKSEEQLYNFGSGQSEVEYDYYHGYRYFDKYDLEPLFPFGYGLSYTNYSYSDIRLNTSLIGKEDILNVYFNITNTGDVDGEESAQLYIGYKNSNVDRAVRDLKGFKKVYLKSSETKTVCINISAQDLAYYDVNLSQWIVEPITYKVEVGGSSRSLPLQTEFKILD